MSVKGFKNKVKYNVTECTCQRWVLYSAKPSSAEKERPYQLKWQHCTIADNLRQWKILEEGLLLIFSKIYVEHLDLQARGCMLHMERAALRRHIRSPANNRQPGKVTLCTRMRVVCFEQPLTPCAKKLGEQDIRYTKSFFLHKFLPPVCSFCISHFQNCRLLGERDVTEITEYPELEGPEGSLSPAVK